MNTALYPLSNCSDFIFEPDFCQNYQITLPFPDQCSTETNSLQVDGSQMHLEEIYSDQGDTDIFDGRYNLQTKQHSQKFYPNPILNDIYYPSSSDQHQCSQQSDSLNMKDQQQQQQLYQNDNKNELEVQVITEKQIKKRIRKPKQNFKKKVHLKEKKDYSTNVAKNFIFAMIKYIQCNQQQIMNWVQQNNYELKNSNTFFNNFLKKKRQGLYSAKHLKQLLATPGVEGKILRIFGYKFLKEELLSYFHQKQFTYCSKQIYFRHTIKEAFLNPEKFNQLTE